MNQHARRTPGGRPGIRRFAWPVLVCGVVCALIARPAYAEPRLDDATTGSGSTVTIPDPGALPIPAAPVTGPSTGGQSATSIPTVTGPYASQITNQYATLEATGEQLKQAGIGLDQAKQTANETYQVWQTALTTAEQLQGKADSAASQAYKDAASLGPFADFATDVHQLGMLAPGLGSQSGQNTGDTAAQDATEARHEADVDEEAYRSALAKERQLEDRQASLQASYNQQSATLTTLQQTNATQVEAAEAAQAASDRQLDGLYGAGTQVNGMVANPQALAALNWAYAQSIANPPKWYKFGAEGPNYFDCSGLTWASYRNGPKPSGYNLPRVAADQYHATSGSRVPATQLLPGDLLFFSTTSKTDWTTISHVAIYFGDNLMVEAAHEGTHVRVSQVWWSAFFGATRVYKAVPAPKPTGSQKPTPKPTNSTPGSTGPTHTPTPTPSQSKPSETPTTPASSPPTSSSAPPSGSSNPTDKPTTTPSGGGSSTPGGGDPSESGTASPSTN